MSKTSYEIELLDRDIEWTTSSEVVYRTDIAFGFISPDYKQCHPIVTCKDYLGDMVFAFLNHGEAFRINGSFNYKYKTSPKISIDPVQIVVSNRNDSCFNLTIYNSIDIIHQSEDALGIDRSVIKKVRNPLNSCKNTGMYLFIGNKDWISSPVMLSLYTLLIRIGKHHKIGRSWLETLALIPIYSDDSLLCEASLPTIKLLLERGWINILGTDIHKNYPATLGESSTHSNFGIYAFSKGYSKTWCPHWYTD